MSRGNRSESSEVKPTSWRAVINDVTPSANTFLRTHWAERKRMASAWYIQIYAALHETGITKAVGKRRVKLWLRSKRQRDYANLFLAADKLILDQLKKLGWLVDDSPKWMTLEMNSGVGDPQTIIEICEEGEGKLSSPSPSNNGGDE